MGAAARAAGSEASDAGTRRMSCAAVAAGAVGAGASPGNDPMSSQRVPEPADPFRRAAPMPRVEAVRRHPLFAREIARVEEAEADREFCRHGLPHLLDVARIAWIRCLEEGLAIPRDVVWAAALLHDIGRAEQYATGEPHDAAGERIAAEILGTVGDGPRFMDSERAAIVAAVAGHRARGSVAGARRDDGCDARARRDAVGVRRPCGSGAGDGGSGAGLVRAGSEGVPEACVPTITADSRTAAVPTALDALPALIAWADHASRACYACPAASSCYWPDAERNLDLRI